MLDAILSVLLELFVEIVLQTLFEIGAHAVTRGLEQVPRPIVVGVLWPLTGALVGGLSVWVLPHPLLHDPWLVLANAVLAPIAGGLAMMGMGALRRKRGQDALQLDTFAMGALFALALVAARWSLATPG